MSSATATSDLSAPVVALVGNPNCGKTTIFNALTGLHQKVANYPGITVERKIGRCQIPGRGRAQIIDLPGTYSLVAGSPDERVTMEVLRGLRPGTPLPQVIVVVVDASNLGRNLFLVSQLMDLGRPLVVALNMIDIAQRRGMSIDVAALSAALGTVVVPIVGHRRQGIVELIRAMAVAQKPPAPPWRLPEALWEEIHRLAQVCASKVPEGTEATEMARRLLIGDTAPDLAILSADGGIAAALHIAHEHGRALGVDPVGADIEARYRWIDALTGKVLTQGPARAHLSERIDTVLMHPVWGLVLFVLIMASLFISIFWLADPLMRGLGDLITWSGQALTAGLAPGPLKDLITNGIFQGVGAVVVFVPQIALLFFFLAVLEDSGYLARAAVLMDRPLSQVGLHGKSFIPLLSSFACAIPGIMATRTIESWRERMATILIAPFMSCSARLPVYGLLIGAFFAHGGPLVQGLVMLGCYLLGIIAAALTALAFKLATRRQGRSPAFMLEMPAYKVPQASQVAMQVWVNTAKFLTKAGTTIFFLSVLLWALAYYPRLAPSQAAAIKDPLAEQQAQLAQSFAGRLGHGIEPVLRPLGFDWKIGVGLVGAFAAREVFNSTLGIIYSVGDPGEDTSRLREAIVRDRRPDGSAVWTPLVSISLLVWFVLAMQCMSTVAVVRRETGGWRWPILQLVFMNVLAYIVCLTVYQVGRHFV